MSPFKTPAFLGALAVTFALFDSGAKGVSDDLVSAEVKEGNLMIYGTTQIDHMHALIKRFNQKYPAIKSNITAKEIPRSTKEFSASSAPGCLVNAMRLFGLR